MRRVLLSSAMALAVASLGWAAPSVAADGPAPQAAPASDKDKDKDKDKTKGKDDKGKAKKAKKPASPVPPKVFTDDDLKKYSDDPEGKPRPKSTGADQAAPADDAGAAPVEEEHGGRQVWKGRVEAARDAIAQAETRVSVIEARIEQLRTDRGVEGAMEPFRLQRIEADIAKAMDELEAANKELAAARAEEEKVFEDARRQGVPLGWLREP